MLKPKFCTPVEVGLFFGDEKTAADLDLLQKYKVTHLVIASRELVPYFSDCFLYYSVFVNEATANSQNMLQGMPAVCKFIDDAKAKQGAVLVYAAAPSPAATVCAAYLMHEKKLSAVDAIKTVLDRIAAASPEGTIELEEYHHEQLLLWEAMGATLIPSHTEYKRFRLALQANARYDFLNEDPAEALAQLAGHERVYSCKTCRRTLYLSGAVLPHEQAKHDFSKKKGSDKNQKSSHIECTSYFIETYRWMGALDENEGKLSCPKCSARVGSYNWAGQQCSCGTWVRPAFQIVKSKVDEMPLNIRRPSK